MLNELSDAVLMRRQYALEQFPILISCETLKLEFAIALACVVSGLLTFFHKFVLLLYHSFPFLMFLSC